jgi:hypothetical protein
MTIRVYSSGSDGNGNPMCTDKTYDEGVANQQVTPTAAYNAADGHYVHGFTGIGNQAVRGRMSIDYGEMAANISRMSVSDMQDLLQ